MMPPTLSAPLRRRASTASLVYSRGSTLWASTRTVIGCTLARMATLRPAGVEPTGFGRLRMRGSAADIAATTSFVPSTLGPRARMTSNGPS
jgi:hypothetical protein